MTFRVLLWRKKYLVYSHRVITMFLFHNNTFVSLIDIQVICTFYVKGQQIRWILKYYFSENQPVIVPICCHVTCHVKNSAFVNLRDSARYGTKMWRNTERWLAGSSIHLWCALKTKINVIVFQIGIPFHFTQIFISKKLK